jgi:hypothetical protein
LHGTVVCEKRKIGGGKPCDRLAAAVCDDDRNGDEIGANFNNLIVRLRANEGRAKEEQETYGNKGKVEMRVRA